MGKKILVVDDETDICAYLKDTLECETFTVEAVKTGDEAVEKLNQGSFDAVLIDIRLESRISGVDVIKKCRELSSLPSVIVISATPAHLLKPMFDQEGIAAADIADILEKPADLKPGVMVSRINTALRKRG